MYKRKIHNKIQTLFVLLVLIVFLPTHLYASNKDFTVIRGKITNQKGEVVDNAIISIATQENGTPLAYTESDEKGNYVLKFKSSAEVLFIKVQHLSMRPIVKKSSNKSQELNLQGETTSFQLAEVIVKAPPIRFSGDTTSYRISYYTEDADKKLADVLKRMPGVSVDDNGKVSFNGREISELQVDGLNLFDGKYNIALDRLKPEDIVSVDVIQNYQPIKVLQKSRLSDAVAMNLKLSPKAKNVLTGRLEIGSGWQQKTNNWLYDGSVSMGLFNANTQSFLTLESNNSGEFYQQTYANKILDNTEHILSSSLPNTPLRQKNSYLFNKGKAFSYHGAWRITKEQKLQYNITALSEETNGSSSTKYDYNLSSGKLVTHNRNLFYGEQYKKVDLGIVYEYNKSNVFIKNKFNVLWDKDTPEVSVVTKSPLVENLNLPANTIYNAFRIIRKFGEVRGIDFSLNTYLNQSNERLLLEASPTLVSGKAANRESIQQSLNYKKGYLEARMESLSTFRKGSLSIDPYLFSIIDWNTINTSLTSNVDSLFDVNSLLSDRVKYHRARIGFGLSFQYALGGWQMVGYIPLLYSHLEIEGANVSNKKNFGSCEPTITFMGYLFNNVSFKLNWSRDNSFNRTEDFIHSLVAKNSYEIERSNISEIFKTSSDKVSTFFEYKNPFKMFFGNLHLLYQNIQHPMIMNTKVENSNIEVLLEPYSYSTRILTAGTQVSKSFDWKKTMIKAGLDYRNTNSSAMYQSVLNHFHIHSIISSLRIGMKPFEWLGGNMQVQYVWSKYTQSGETNNYQKAVLSDGNIVLNKKNLSLVIEGQYYAERADQPSDLCLFNMMVGWKMRNMEWTLSLRNIMNVSAYHYHIVNNLQNQINGSYALLPRSIMLKVMFNIK